MSATKEIIGHTSSGRPIILDEDLQEHRISMYADASGKITFATPEDEQRILGQPIKLDAEGVPTFGPVPPTAPREHLKPEAAGYQHNRRMLAALASEIFERHDAKLVDTGGMNTGDEDGSFYVTGWFAHQHCCKVIGLTIEWPRAAGDWPSHPTLAPILGQDSYFDWEELLHLGETWDKLMAAAQDLDLLCAEYTPSAVKDLTVWGDAKFDADGSISIEHAAPSGGRTRAHRRPDGKVGVSVRLVDGKWADLNIMTAHGMSETLPQSLKALAALSRWQAPDVNDVKGHVPAGSK